MGYAAHEGGEQVDSCRDREAQGREEKVPGSGQQDEKRISRWMGDAEDVPRRNVFARIPVRGRRRQRQCIQETDTEAYDQGPEIDRFRVRQLRVHRSVGEMILPVRRELGGRSVLTPIHCRSGKAVKCRFPH